MSKKDEKGTELLTPEMMGTPEEITDPEEPAVTDDKDSAAEKVEKESAEKEEKNLAEKSEEPVEDAAEEVGEDEITDVLIKKKEEETVPQRMGAKSEARKWAKDSKAEDDIEEYKKRKKEKKEMQQTEKGGVVKFFGILALIGMLAGAVGIGLILAFYVFIPGEPVYKGAAAKGFSAYSMDGYVPAEPEKLPTPTDAVETIVDDTTEVEPTPTDATDTDAAPEGGKDVGAIGGEV